MYQNIISKTTSSRLGDSWDFGDGAWGKQDLGRGGTIEVQRNLEIRFWEISRRLATLSPSEIFSLFNLDHFIIIDSHADLSVILLSLFPD